MEVIDSVDIAIFMLLIIVNFFLWKQKASSSLMIFAFIFLLGFLFPYLSSERKVARSIVMSRLSIRDSFELLYTSFTFPIYWGILAFQLLFISYYIPKVAKKVSFENILDQE